MCRKPRPLLALIVTLFMALPMACAGGGGETAATTTTPSSTATTTTPSSNTTSTASISTSTSEPASTTSLPAGLPSAVAEMWARILAAARAGDYEGLANLALQGSTPFTYTFGGDQEGPAAYWRAETDRGEDVLDTLVEILQMPYGRDGDLYLWPEAYLWEAPFTAEQRDLLAQHFSKDDISGWEAFGGYIGYRIGITQDGDWIFFVSGD